MLADDLLKTAKIYLESGRSPRDAPLSKAN